MKLNLTPDFVQAVTDQLELDVRPDYSGRGMYGHTCFGIVGSARDLARFLIELSDIIDGLNSYEGDEHGQFVDTDMEPWYDVHQDSMGWDTIYYWPSIRVVDPEDTDKDADL